MAWTPDDYPVAFAEMSDEERAAAIESANAALEGGKSEKDAIKEALSDANKEEAVELDPADRLVPHSNGWAVLNKAGTKVLEVYGFHKVAARRLKELDKAGVS